MPWKIKPIHIQLIIDKNEYKKGSFTLSRGYIYKCVYIYIPVKENYRLSSCQIHPQFSMMLDLFNQHSPKDHLQGFILSTLEHNVGPLGDHMNHHDEVTLIYPE